MLAFETSARLLGCLVLILAAACKPVQSKTGSRSQLDLPQRRGGEADATAAKKVGSIAEGGRIVVDLERVPLPGSVAPWACFDLPPVDFALGRVQCASNPSLSHELTGAHAGYVCSSFPDFGTVQPRQALSLDSSCSAYDVLVYAFEPALVVHVEAK